MTKAMIIVLIVLAILFGGIYGVKILEKKIIKKLVKAYESERVTVSTMPIKYAAWPSKHSYSGSLRAIRGVNVTTEMAGMVQKIYFTPGQDVKQGTTLVQLNADSDVAQLHSLQANANLAKVTYKRDKAQFAAHAISKATLDTDIANLKSTEAQSTEQKAMIAKKTIRAPFSGRLGVSAINPGQYLSPGNSVVSLQTYDPIYIDFYVPQQDIGQFAVGQPVVAKNNTYQEKRYTGKITTIDSEVDSNTRNIEIEATIKNPDKKLIPGMYAIATVTTGKPKRYLTLPQTAITFNPFGSIVYIVKPSGKKDASGKPIMMALQVFVTTGDTRGDQITILTGLKEGQIVVTSGQLKLKNRTLININNAVQPDNNPDPKVVDN